MPDKASIQIPSSAAIAARWRRPVAVIRRAASFSETDVRHTTLLAWTPGDGEPESLNLREVRQHAESKAIRVALTKSYGNISKAAALLGITRPTLYDLLNKYGVSAEGYSKKAASGGE